MADIDIRAPLETPMFVSENQLSVPWQEYFATLKDRLDDALGTLEISVDAEIVDLNITGKLLMDNVTLIDEQRNITDAKDLGAETLTLTGDATIAGDATVTGDVSADSFNASTGVVIEKTSGLGIKVDLTAPTFGWGDIIGPIRKRGVGATDPGDATYIGNVKQWQFAVGDEVWNEFHLPHDYVPGSDIHIHFHWSHVGTLVTGGTVTWGADVTYAKGHNQAPFIATVNPTIAGTASTTRYQHIITEVQLSAASPSATQIDSDNIEPDGVIMMRTYLSANAITVSGGGVPDPFLHFVDIHYQSTGIGTKQKAPDFYV